MYNLWNGLPVFSPPAATSAAAGGVLRTVVGGRYGLGSKDFTPAMAKAVYDNLKADKPKDKFTVSCWAQWEQWCGMFI
jgi:pyruvate-ferredoxin/flavodoxin oxidoreductase